MSNLWWLGALISFFATVGNTFGINCQKLSAIKMAEQIKDGSVEEAMPYTSQPIWILGMTMIVLCSLFDFLALSISAQSIVSPVKSSALVANLVFAHFWLGEVLNWRDVYGCCFIVFGSLISVIFGSQESRNFDLQQLKSKFGNIPILIFWSFTFIFCIIFYVISRWLEKKRGVLESFLKELNGCHDDNLLKESLENLKQSKDYAEAQKAYEPHMKLHSFVFCGLSGALGSQSLTFAKMLGTLFRTTVKGDNQMVYPMFYVFLLLLLLFIASQVHFLNKALIISDALFVVPVFQCFFITVGTIGGLLFYEEYSTYELENWILACVGLITILFGVYTLSSRDFESLEVQFQLPDIPDDESVSAFKADNRPLPSRRLSVRLSVSHDPHIFETGGTFTEMASIPGTPLANELMHGAKWLAPRRRTDTHSVDRMDSSVERNGRWKNVFSSDFPEMSRSEDLNVTGYSSDAYDEASLSRSRNSQFEDESSSPCPFFQNQSVKRHNVADIRMMETCGDFTCLLPADPPKDITLSELWITILPMVCRLVIVFLMSADVAQNAVLGISAQLLNENESHIQIYTSDLHCINCF